MTSPIAHELTEPSESRALLSLERVLGPDEALRVWAAARAACGFVEPHGPLTRDELRSVAVFLSMRPGVVGAMGVSLRIRIDTYETLVAASRRTAASADSHPDSPSRRHV